MVFSPRLGSAASTAAIQSFTAFQSSLFTSCELMQSSCLDVDCRALMHLLQPSAPFCKHLYSACNPHPPGVPQSAWLRTFQTPHQCSCRTCSSVCMTWAQGRQTQDEEQHNRHCQHTAASPPPAAPSSRCLLLPFLQLLLTCLPGHTRRSAGAAGDQPCPRTASHRNHAPQWEAHHHPAQHR